MEEIKVGEYVRTDNGEIHKVEDIEDLRIHIKTEKIMFRSWVDDYYGAHKEDRFIVKHSSNIIDLIEEGDYVNGIEVMGIYIPRDTWEPIQINVDSQTIKYFLVDEIKSIATKEQFNSIKYEV